MRGLRAAILASTVALTLAASAAPAMAANSTERWDLHNCAGPAGTPTSFSAIRNATGFGSALKLVDRPGVFVVLSAYNEDLGMWLHPPSPGTTNAASVTCSVTGPRMGYLLTVSGILSMP